MRRRLGLALLLLGVTGLHCTGSGQGAADLAPGPDPVGDMALPSDDGGSRIDLGIPPDLAPPPPTTLTRIAGGIGGAGSADDTGAAARFYAPHAAVADGIGNLYVADSFSHTVRKIVLATGVVTTVAGLAGVRGAVDDVGSAARFYNPQGVALDGAGNLLVADTNNRAIRKIVLSTGAVSTFAGSLGVQGNVDGSGNMARFNGPQGMALDGAGNLYVTDIYSHTIRKIALGMAAVSTLAGSAGTFGATDGTGAAARFNSPTAVAYDGGANLLVADWANHTVRKIVIATGAVTTLAGMAGVTGSSDGTGSAARFSAPWGVAADGAGNVLVSDAGNGTLRSIVISTGVVTTRAGTAGMMGGADGTAASARFQSPFGLALGGAGTVYVVDSGNNAIRQVLLGTAAVTTLAGAATQAGASDGVGPAARFLNAHGIAADGAGNVWVADTDNSTVRQVVVATGAVTTLAGAARVTGGADGVGGAARFNYPAGIAADGAGNLYVADTFNATIRKIVVGTGQVSTLAGSAGMGGNSDGTGAAARFALPYGLAVDGAGSVFVADTGNHTIRRVVISTGQVTTLAGLAGAAGSTDGAGSVARFNNPYGVAADGVGNVYVADSINHTIRKFVINGAVVTTLAGTAGQAGFADGVGVAARFSGPSKVALDGLGSLYVADWSNAAIRKIDLASGTVATVVGIGGQTGVKPGPLPGRLNQAVGVALSPARRLFVLDRGENCVLSVD